jgi:hypothetical protein
MLTPLEPAKKRFKGKPYESGYSGWCKEVAKEQIDWYKKKYPHLKLHYRIIEQKIEKLREKGEYFFMYKLFIEVDQHGYWI